MDTPVTRAFLLAAELHVDQTRKASLVPNTPYLSHLLEVAALVMACNPPDYVVAAAFLHDAIEDQGTQSRERIFALLGPQVLALVEECTEPGTGAVVKAPWLERKRGYIEHVRVASLYALVITCADKLQNLRDLRRQFVVDGNAAFAVFNASKADKIWFYREVLEAARARSTELKAEQPALPIFIALDYMLHEQEDLLNYLQRA